MRHWKSYGSMLRVDLPNGMENKKTMDECDQHDGRLINTMFGSIMFTCCVGVSIRCFIRHDDA